MKRLALDDDRFWELLRNGLDRLAELPGSDTGLIEEARARLVSLESITRAVVEHFPELETLQQSGKGPRRLPARR